VRLYPRAAKSRLFDDLRGRAPRLAGVAYERGDLATEFVAPSTETERTVAGIVRHALGLDRIGVRDDFFELGGDSIMAGGVIGRCNAVFGLDLTLEDVVEAFTVERLSMEIDRRLRVAIDEMTEEQARELLRRIDAGS